MPDQDPTHAPIVNAGTKLAVRLRPNSGVWLAGFGFGTLLAPLQLSIAAGLVIGKQISVPRAVWNAVRLSGVTRPRRASRIETYGTTLVCGICFATSLLIGDLAITDATLEREATMGVLVGWALSAIAGSLTLYLAGFSGVDRSHYSSSTHKVTA